MSGGERIYLYDTTLRDGAQTQGVDFSVTDKTSIAEALDDLGVAYVEGGWPGANPTDDSFFDTPPKLAASKFTAFGMTRKSGHSAANDPGLSAVINTRTDAVCIVGKTWDFHVTTALETSLEDNLAAIRDSVAEIVKSGREALFDCEHYFDGYKANPDYALECAKAAHEAGARWIVLCDTNGGALPHEITEIVEETSKHIPGDKLGIHTHDDTENAVANSLAAVRAGARMVQGTLNGLGERCGNANLISLIPTLELKMGFDCGIGQDGIKKLTKLSRMLDELLNRSPMSSAPYVGTRAFAHKGGLHVSAIAKDPASYEHIDPSSVGNRRNIIVSDQAGRSNVLARLEELGISADADTKQVAKLVSVIKQREFEGYAYDGAEASFELLARRMLDQVPQYFDVLRYSVTDERRYNVKGKLVTESEASVKVAVGGEVLHTVAEGNGPVNAIDLALRKALVPYYPELKDMYLLDYRVRILKTTDASAAMPRVLIESGSRSPGEEHLQWFTIGVSTNIIEASFDALGDSFTYRLFRQGVNQAKGA